MVPRPGPLRDLPLERFIDVPFTPIPTTPRRTHKRPLSPGTPNLFSPTKKRILAQEGVFSPEKTIKSSFVPSDRGPVVHDVLMGSPARKLDFGRLPQTYSEVASTSRLFEAYPAEPTPEHNRWTGQHDRHQPSLSIPHPIPPQLLPTPSSFSAPQTNIHYPGFDVWVDRDRDPSPLLPSHFSFDDPCAPGQDKENSCEDKENARPKAKLRTGLSKRMKRVSFMSPEQPRRQNTLMIPFTPLNARSPFETRPPRGQTPGKVLRVDKDEMRRRRELLAMEVDGESSDDDF